MGERVIAVDDVDGIIAARQAGREMARIAGFGSIDQTRIITAISELTRNALIHASSGICTLTDDSDDKFIRIAVRVDDHGPGIPDIEQALADGFTTIEGSYGSGLPIVGRLLSTLVIESEPGHTVVSAAMSRHRSDLR